MATIRKRGVRWQAQVRLQGHAPITKSFMHRADAEAWARQQEVDIERGEIQSARKSLKTYVLADLLTRYQIEVTPKKRGAASELFRLKTLKAAPIASLPLDKLTPSVLARYRDERLLVVSAPSVRRELGILQHCLEVARKDWGVPLPRNPMEDVRKAQSAKARTRRVRVTVSRARVILVLVAALAFSDVRIGNPRKRDADLLFVDVIWVVGSAIPVEGFLNFFLLPLPLSGPAMASRNS